MSVFCVQKRPVNLDIRKGRLYHHEAMPSFTFRAKGFIDEPTIERISPKALIKPPNQNDQPGVQQQCSDEAGVLGVVAQLIKRSLQLNIITLARVCKLGMTWVAEVVFELHLYAQIFSRHTRQIGGKD